MIGTGPYKFRLFFLSSLYSPVGDIYFMHVLRALIVMTAFILFFNGGCSAWNEGHEGLLPDIHYLLKVDTADLSGYEVEIHLRDVPSQFQLAMATHHEYDDRFWRFIGNFRVETPGGNAAYVRKDSAVWEISVPGHDAVISYRLQLPGLPRFSHRPFLSSNGGLIGDIHSFMYLVGYTRDPCSVTFALPKEWQIATGLEKTKDSLTFRASSAKELLDCPALVGHLHQWSFRIEGVPHTVVYLPVSSVPAFDTALLVNNVQKIVMQTIRLFGGTPYKHYTFLLEDGVYGALEHANSVTIGAPAALLSGRMQDIYEEIAHEFSHTWNLMSIQPAEYTGLNYGPKERSAGLWFSEGLAMFYADLLLRRADLPCEDSTRIAHLTSLIGRYYADTGNRVLPPSIVSLAANEAPGALGDYSASVHLQGELLGAMLDLLIRNATEGRRSFDDVMALMFKRFGGKKGFYTRDIEQVATEVCGSDEVHAFFKNYIYDGSALDFDLYLRLIGLKMQLLYQPARDDKGQLAADARLYIWQPPGDTTYHLGMTSPGSCWVRAGLHTGDAIAAINGLPIKNRQDFQDMIKTLKIGDSVIAGINRSAGVQRIPVVITGYEIPVVHIIKDDNPDSRVQNLYRQWEQGK